MNSADSWLVLGITVVLGIVIWLVFILLDKAKDSFIGRLSFRLLMVNILLFVMIGSGIYLVVALSAISIEEAEDSPQYRINEFRDWESHNSYSLVADELYENNCYGERYDAVWERIMIRDSYQRYSFYSDAASQIIAEGGDAGRAAELQSIAEEYRQEATDACQSSTEEDNAGFVAEYMRLLK